MGGNNNPTGKGGLGERPHDINRTGKNRGSVNIPNLIRRIIAEDTKDGISRGEAIVRKCLEKAEAGDHNSLRFLAEYMHGKPTQGVVLDANLHHDNDTDSLSSSDLREIIDEIRNPGEDEQTGKGETPPECGEDSCKETPP